MFKKENPFTKRLQKSNELRAKYPDRCPVICEKSFPEYDPRKTLVKSKYLVLLDFTFGEFIYKIRQQLTLPSHMAIFFFINNSVLPSANARFSTLYDSYKESDGFLYLTYTDENIFG